MSDPGGIVTDPAPSTEDIAKAREFLAVVGIATEGLTDEEIADRCRAVISTMIGVGKAIAPIVGEHLRTLSEGFEKLAAIARKLDELDLTDA